MSWTACGRTVASFDGVPLDVNVTLPADGDGPWPLVIGFHGFGGQKRGFAARPPHEGPRRLARRGIAVLNPTSRGFHGSCGSLEARAASPVACTRGSWRPGRSAPPACGCRATSSRRRSTPRRT